MTDAIQRLFEDAVDRSDGGVTMCRPRDTRNTPDAHGPMTAARPVTERPAVPLPGNTDRQTQPRQSVYSTQQWRRQDFVTGGSEVWVHRGSRVRSPPVPVVLSVYQRGSLLDGLAMYLSCDTKKFRDNESTHILHNFWTSSHRGKLFPFPPR